MTPTVPFVHVRFHGLVTKYGGARGEEALRPWAARCREWLAPGREVWAFSDNDVGGHAPVDAARLEALVTTGDHSQTGVQLSS